MHDRNLLMDVVRRVLDFEAGGTNELAEDVFRNPVARYVDEDLWRAEIDVLFGEWPLCAGLSCELSKPGDFKTLDLPGAPVVLVRGQAGELRAFLNVCRHRGARLVEGRGHGRRITCPFHAWSFGTDGELLGVPYEQGFCPDGCEVDRSELALTPLPAAERHGLMFVVPSREGLLDLEAHLGSLDDELSRLGLSGLHYFGTRDIESEMNWHVAMDTYSEAYHFPFLHKGSVGTVALGNVHTQDSHGPHQRVAFAARTLLALRDAPEETWDPENHLDILYLLFPNSALLWTAKHVSLFQIIPGSSVDKSITHHHFYTWEEVAEEDREGVAAFFAQLNAVVRDEDYATGVQKGLRSGAQEFVVFGRHERALHHMHRAYAEAMLHGSSSTSVS